jgi:ribonuclease HII
MIVAVPHLLHEIAAGFGPNGPIICGVDEVGRGCLAGPVVAAAAILPKDGLPETLTRRIRDSKQMTPAQRQALFPTLSNLCAHTIAEANIAEIAQLNILGASLLAMRRAIMALTPLPDCALIDGNQKPPDLPCAVKLIIKGDSQSLSIAIAAILAKVTRDRIMAKLAEAYPVYGWERNAGYGTPEHLQAMAEHGTSPWHRDSFAPVRRINALSR